MIEWRRHLHQNPEPGNREVETARLVAERLRSFGLAPRTGAARTGVVAVIEAGRPGPVVALRAEMDALPVTEEVDLPFASKATATWEGKTVGVMHACRHDTHTKPWVTIDPIVVGSEILGALQTVVSRTVDLTREPAVDPPQTSTAGRRRRGRSRRG